MCCEATNLERGFLCIGSVYSSGWRICLLLNSHLEKFASQMWHHNSNVLAMHPFLFLSATSKEWMWKYPQPGVCLACALTPFRGTISCWFLSLANTPCFSFIMMMNIARCSTSVFRHQAENRCCCLGIRRSFFSGDNWYRARIVRQSPRWKMKTRKLYKIGRLMVCSSAMKRISGVTKRKSSSGGLTFEWDRFPLQTCSCCLFYDEQFYCSFVHAIEEDGLIWEPITKWLMALPRKTGVVVQTSGGMLTYIHFVIV